MLPLPLSVINNCCTLYSTCKEHVILNACLVYFSRPTELSVALFGGCVALTQEHRSIRHLLFVVELVYIDRKIGQFRIVYFYM